MKKYRLISTATIASSLSLSFFANANVASLSRANCLGFINESITYDRPEFAPFIGSASSAHMPWGSQYPVHDTLLAPNTGDSFWRFYAGDIGDAQTVTVYGGHSWMYVDGDGAPTGEGGFRTTLASDCNLSEW